jgi:hypothetical protein
MQKLIVVEGKEYKLNIFVERRSSVRASFVNNGINIRIPKHLSNEEKNRTGKEMLDWAVEKIKSEPEKYKEKIYSSGDVLSAFGASYEIVIDFVLTSKNSFREKHGELLFRISNDTSKEKAQEYIRQKVRKTLAKNHLEDIEKIVHKINQEHFGKKLGKISIKHTTSRWGQCHVRHANIDFSTRLLLAPLPVIEYVVVHELAHLIYADHSKRFWGVVGRVDPTYKAKVKWLSKRGHLLTL